MDNLILETVYWLQIHLSAEVITVWLFLFCAITILTLLKLYGAFGLYVYNAIAIVVANIQVLRFTQYATFNEPVALGTVLFTTTFFVNDVLTEHYGTKYAKRAVTLGFLAQILVCILMLFALGHPLPTINSPAIVDANKNYFAMLQLFTPSLRILIASLVAYICSQFLDIILFSSLRKITNGRMLWFRQNMAMLLSGFFDTCLFSAIAWVWLCDTPVSWRELLFTYILSAQIIRLLLNVSFTPLMYLSYYFLPNEKLQFYNTEKRTQSV